MLTSCAIGTAGQPTPQPPQPAGTPAATQGRPAPPPQAAPTGASAPAPPGTTIAARATPPAPVLSASPTAARGPRATRLTREGCCPAPQWLADGSGVFYYGEDAAPGAIAPGRGTWSVARGGGPPRWLSAYYGAFSLDGSLVAYPDGQLTRIARLDGTPLGAVQTRGARAYFAPTNDRVAWLSPAPDVPDPYLALEPPSRVAVARVDGGEVRVLPPALRTEALQWFSDGRRLLINGRDGAAAHPGLWVLDADSGAIARLVDGPFLESPLISPDGHAIAVTATLRPEPAHNGVWLIGADGGGARRLPFLGGYRWAPDGRSLLYVPAPTGTPTDELWRYRLADGQTAPLVRASQVQFSIAEDEWEVSPDGGAIAFRSATDGAIWVLEFGP